MQLIRECKSMLKTVSNCHGICKHVKRCTSLIFWKQELGNYGFYRELCLARLAEFQGMYLIARLKCVTCTKKKCVAPLWFLRAAVWASQYAWGGRGEDLASSRRKSQECDTGVQQGMVPVALFRRPGIPVG